MHSSHDGKPRTALMKALILSILEDKPIQAPLARSARQATYETCRKCGDMMIQDAKGGLVCINPHSDTGNSLSRQSELTDVNR